MTLWWRSELTKRDTFFKVPDAKNFPSFKPSYENEKHDMWAVMRMDYQKRWEVERDEVRDDYEFYRKEKAKYLQRGYVTRQKMAEVRKAQLLARKVAEISTPSKFAGIQARVDSNLKALRLKRSQSESSRDIKKQKRSLSRITVIPDRSEGSTKKTTENQKEAAVKKKEIVKNEMGGKEVSKNTVLKNYCQHDSKTENPEHQKSSENPEKYTKKSVKSREKLNKIEG